MDLKLDDWSKSSSFLAIGSIHRELNNFQEAWQNYSKAINLREEQYFSSEEYVPTLDDAAIYNEASRILFDLKDYSRALEYGQKGLEILSSTFGDSNNIVIQCKNFLEQVKETAEKSPIK